MSAQPLTQPLLVPVGEEDYLLVRDYVYTWRADLLRHQIVIACGDESDGASVPRLAWTAAGITPDGLIRAAALVHDWLYKWGGAVPVYRQAEPVGPFVRKNRVFARAEADALFLQIMGEAGVGAIRRRLAYLGVRMFGWISWKTPAAAKIVAARKAQEGGTAQRVNTR